jgi:hypothetical protein
MKFSNVVERENQKYGTFYGPDQWLYLIQSSFCDSKMGLSDFQDSPIYKVIQMVDQKSFLGRPTWADVRNTNPGQRHALFNSFKTQQAQGLEEVALNYLKYEDSFFVKNFRVNNLNSDMQTFRTPDGKLFMTSHDAAMSLTEGNDDKYLEGNLFYIVSISTGIRGNCNAMVYDISDDLAAKLTLQQYVLSPNQNNINSLLKKVFKRMSTPQRSSDETWLPGLDDWKK